MPIYYCVLDFCPSKVGDPVSFHKFPRDEQQRNAWIDFVRATGRHCWTPRKTSMLCSLHFCSDAYQAKYAASFGIPIKGALVPGAVPTVYPTAAQSLLASERGATTPKRRVLRDILVVPSVENIWVTDDVGANVEVGAAESYKLASCNFASRQRAGTSEVVTQTWDDLNDTIPNVSVLNKPHDEHAYASRWCPPTCIAAGTQVNLYLFESSKKDHGSQTDFDMFGYTGRTLSSYGRRIGYPSHSEHSWPQRGCCCE
ncbi:hypothetical protein MTO96_034790 [Rhipicephalus appendiculatus]